MAEIVIRERWLERVRGAVRPRAGETPGLLSASTGLMAIVGVYLYFTGYIFSFFYYKAFGVPMESLDLSSQYFLIMAFTVFRTMRGLVLFAALVGIAFGYATGKIRMGLLLVVLIGAFPALFFMSYHVARVVAVEERSKPESYIQFQFKKPESAMVASPSGDAGSTDELMTLSKSGELHTLSETKDRIVVFYQPPSLIPNEVPAVEVYTLLRSDLAWSVVTAN